MRCQFCILVLLPSSPVRAEPVVQASQPVYTLQPCCSFHVDSCNGCKLGRTLLLGGCSIGAGMHVQAAWCSHYYSMVCQSGVAFMWLHVVLDS